MNIMMADDELEIDENKFLELKDTIEGCFGRAEKLFRVRIDRKISSSGSSAPGNDFANIRRGFQRKGIVTFKITSNESSTACVRDAKDFISKVVDGDETTQIMTINCPPSSSSAEDTGIRPPYHPISLSSRITYQENDNINCGLSQHNLRDENSIFGYPNIQTTHEIKCVNPPNYIENIETDSAASISSQNQFPEFQNIQLCSTGTSETVDNLTSRGSGTASFNSSSLSSDFDNGILSDPSYITKAERFLKLDYPEHHVLLAFEKVGLDAPSNDVLSELIRLGGGMKLPEEGAEFFRQDLDSHATEDTGDYADNSDNNLRPIVIDGSNVAMSHGPHEIFSCKGIKIAVDWFKEHGHTDIRVFVPQWRKEASRPDAPISGQDILTQLEREKILVFTPARRVEGRRVVCYDDRYILKLAVANGGIVVSNDNYRDLINENPEFKKVVEKRLLMYVFVDDQFMPPDDPCGKYGPRLHEFLQKEPKHPKNLPPVCPYGKKCTYGNKCKYYHPERQNLPHKSVTDKLAEQSKQKIVELKERGVKPDDVENLKRKPKPKLTLSRTLSLGPSMAFMEKDESREGKVLSKEKLEQNRAYEERLNEKRKEMERIEEEEKTRRKHEGEQISKCFLTDIVNVASEGRPLITVTADKSIEKQQFVSGHLQLAERLSDDSKDSTSKSDSSFAVDSETLKSTAPTEPKIPIQRQVSHPKLTRQLGVMGRNDPRLNQNSRYQTPFGNPQPNTTQSVPEMSTPPYSRQDSRGVERCTTFPLSPADYHYQFYNRQQSMCDSPMILPTEVFADRALDTHSPLFPRSPRNPFFNPRMVRQDSTSDPEIHRMNVSTSQHYNPSYSRSVSVSTPQQFSSPPFSSHVQSGSYVGIPPLLYQNQSDSSHLQQHQVEPYPFSASTQMDPWQPLMSPPPQAFPAQQTFSNPNVTSYSSGPEIHPQDPRYSTFYHLSHLFGAKNVTEVMNRHPDINNPSELVRLLNTFPGTNQ